MVNFSFPGWAGPAVGATVGLGIGAVCGLSDGPGVSGPWLALWAAAGAAVGCIVWLADTSVRRRRSEENRLRRRPAVESPALRAGLWAGLALMLAVGPVVAYLGVEKFAAARRMTRWPTAEATILESHVKAASHTSLDITTESYTPVVRYRYTVDGVEREGGAIDQSPTNISYSERGKADAAVARYPAGSAHPAYYDPADPARAVLEAGVPWGEAVPVVLVPLVAVGASLIAALALRAEAEGPPTA